MSLLKLSDIFFPEVNLDVHVTKISTFRIDKGGGLGGYPPRSRRNFKKSNKMEAFPLFVFFFFLLFGRAP